MVDPGELREGMTVKDLEGRRLGTVVHVGDTHFELEQGSPAQREFMVRFHAVDRVEHGEAFLHPGHGVKVPVESEEAGAPAQA
ncbi:DUF2171 domain-containing protein [Pyxidicoccus caerfyrddinensis]|uniref:DUF2171 domain-containing protein n=1 Tax=Pyxidicoccus caerfyrddinensis TaxID=2709663 RepID=UPI0013DCDB92|nr:DUF2171 domain-containing protein [Pyxidicoccus caerfyrddinensis]